MVPYNLLELLYKNNIAILVNKEMAYDKDIVRRLIQHALDRGIVQIDAVDNGESEHIRDVINNPDITFPNLSIFDALKINMRELKNANVSTHLYLVDIPDGMNMVFSRNFVFNKIVMMQHGSHFKYFLTFLGIDLYKISQGFDLPTLSSVMITQSELFTGEFNS